MSTEIASIGLCQPQSNPKPKSKTEFWELLDKLYKVHDAFKKCVPYYPTVVEKTVPNEDMQDFFDVFSYVKNPLKTKAGEYVSAINCLKETALEQMILTKKQYQKTGGYIAWHGYQSFKPDEVTPEQCHEIGLKLAREMSDRLC